MLKQSLRLSPARILTNSVWFICFALVDFEVTTITRNSNAHPYTKALVTAAGPSCQVAVLMMVAVFGRVSTHIKQAAASGVAGLFVAETLALWLLMNHPRFYASIKWPF